MSSLAIKSMPRAMPKITSILLTLLGFTVIILALFSYLTEQPIEAIFHWLERMFSIAFIVIFTALISLSVFAVVQLKSYEQSSYWHEVGQQAGNGIATLALTFTLLGISLGIGTLAEQPLTPENIQQMISALTKQFSMAFMTTVVGLPAATLVRALVGIKYQRTLLSQNLNTSEPKDRVVL